jgi:hypothetical protein
LTGTLEELEVSEKLLLSLSIEFIEELLREQLRVVHVVRIVISLDEFFRNGVEFLCSPCSRILSRAIFAFCSVSMFLLFQDALIKSILEQTHLDKTGLGTGEYAGEWRVRKKVSIFFRFSVFKTFDEMFWRLFISPHKPKIVKLCLYPSRQKIFEHIGCICEMPIRVVSRSGCFDRST